MEIRKIKPDEKIISSLVEAIVFIDKLNDDYREKLANPLENSEGYEEVWGGFNGAGKMEASMQVLDFNVRFDGHSVGMAGIGGVSTLPEARTGGYIRKIFEKALPAAREEGKIFSYLYPFSFEFYRKFGYELCYQKNQIEMPTGAFGCYKFPEGMEAYEPGKELEPYARLYGGFIEDKNLAVVRDVQKVKNRIDNDPYLTRKYAYLHRNKIGEPDAYILFLAERSGGDNVLNAYEIIWTTPESLHAIFGFIGGLSPQFKIFRWQAPSGINAAALFPNCYDVSVTKPMYGMNRVLNPLEAFKKIKAPRANGSASIKVADRFLPVNDGTYTVEWENGKVSSVKLTDKSPDMETDVETLVQLMTGFLTPAEAKIKKSVSVNGGETALEMLFPHKDMCIYNYF